MSKLYLNYNPSTGQIIDATGYVVATMSGYPPVTIDDSSSVDEMIKLKNAGFTAQEIIEMRKAGL